jgi:hypothetical protein
VQHPPIEIDHTRAPEHLVSAYAALLSVPMTIVQRQVIEALVEHGSQGAAAAALGYKRSRVQSALRLVQHRARMAAVPVAADPAPVVALGRISTPSANAPETPPGARVARYILTSAQNNTYVHNAFLANLEAYARATGARIMIARYSYNKAAYGKGSTKAGRAPTASDTNGLWYDPAIADYVCDDPARHGSCRWQLAPDLVWCAEMNILPTAVLPLSGLESYTASASGVFPHAKIALESVAVIGDRPPKFNYTTGTVTQRNYIAKKEGLKGEFHHQFGALFVEVDLVTGDWWARHLNADADGSFYDLTWRVAEGAVTGGHRALAINPGDIHASENDPECVAAIWGPGRALDTLRPEYQFWHDSDSFRNRTHHEMKSFEKRFRKWAAGDRYDVVENEIGELAAQLYAGRRDWCQTVIVSSNHDRHGDRWLDDCDPKQDLPNARYFHQASAARTEALEVAPLESDWTFLAWALERAMPGGVPARILPRDATFLIGPAGHEIECGSHGDEGPNGSRGSAAALSKLGVRMNIGHSHSATIRHGLFQAGVCTRRLPYAHGPSSWSLSHILTYANGKRCMLTQRAGKLWI